MNGAAEGCAPGAGALVESVLLVDAGPCAGAAANMARDEALGALAGQTRLAALRVYRWGRPAVTFGYPMRWSEVSAMSGGLPAVRRWTGGGIVEHGGDWVVALFIPAHSGAGAGGPGCLYAGIHRAVARAVSSGKPARLAAENDLRPGARCFESPARHDLMQGSQKIGGGAQRRTRDGLLYQGSFRVDESGDFPGRVAAALAGCVEREAADDAFERAADEIERARYGADSWNRKRP